MVALSNAQVEIVKRFKNNLKEDELAELKRVLIEFKTQLAYRLMNELWKKNGWTQETMEQWAKEHNRTPYKSQNEYLAKQAK